MHNVSVKSNDGSGSTGSVIIDYIEKNEIDKQFENTDKQNFQIIKTLFSSVKRNNDNKKQVYQLMNVFADEDKYGRLHTLCRYYKDNIGEDITEESLSKLSESVYKCWFIKHGKIGRPRFINANDFNFVARDACLFTMLTYVVKETNKMLPELSETLNKMFKLYAASVNLHLSLVKYNKNTKLVDITIQRFSEKEIIFHYWGSVNSPLNNWIGWKAKSLLSIV